MTIQEYAKATGQHPNTIYNQIKRKKLPAHKEEINGKTTWIIEVKENDRKLDDATRG